MRKLQMNRNVFFPYTAGYYRDSQPQQYYTPNTDGSDPKAAEEFQFMSGYNQKVYSVVMYLLFSPEYKQKR